MAELIINWDKQRIEEANKPPEPTPPPEAVVPQPGPSHHSDPFLNIGNENSNSQTKEGLPPTPMEVEDSKNPPKPTAVV